MLESLMKNFFFVDNYKYIILQNYFKKYFNIWFSIL